MDDLMTSSHQGAAPNIGPPPLTREKDPCKAERINEMQKNRDLYKLKYVEGFPLKMRIELDVAETDIKELYAKLTIWTLEKLDDLNLIYSRSLLLEPKDSFKHWKEDTWFGYQRLNRCNPKSIRLCEEIPSKLGVDEAMMEPVLKGETLEGLIKKKRLFYTDLEILDGVIHRKEYDVFLPTDDEGVWTLAKMCFAFEKLMDPGAWVDQTMTIGSEGMIELVCKGLQEWDFYRDGIPANDFANRKGLPMKDGKGHVSSKEDLKWIVSVIIFTCSVSHAAVDFLQYDEYGYPPNYPSMLRTPLLKDKAPRTEKDIVDALPKFPIESEKNY
ncbi:polyunsaturated fatty acid lipoxygenase ALOX15B-like [Octopus vulgaris]|uniref:Polyunsaturated fatty acid lipoxygenase ALOX15B-like n=1 Tax=Octopus vulgaris TaxID=6645 RepID=A0AA36B611_OCTVU|nr:polyunsaturated fatty acid lipoxygenase ALOX15B-like [Octopus vulgaris]